MLRINLLPSYVSQRRLTRKLVLGFVTLLIACAAVPLALYFQAHNQRIDEENQATAAEAGKAKTDALKAQAAAQRSQIAPLKAKVDYVKAVEAYNNSIVAFWNTVAQYSDPKIIYTDAQVAGTALTIKAYSPSIAEVGRYLQAMYQEPDFATVGIDKLPGYPDALVTKYYLDGKLVGIGSAPTFSATGGTTGQTTPAPAQTTANGQKTTFGQVLTPTGSGAGATGTGLFGEVPVSVDQIVASQIPPFATPEQRISYYQRAYQRIQRKTYPKGFEITITATLKTPMNAPVLPGATAASTGPGTPNGYSSGYGGPGRPPAGGIPFGMPGGPGRPPAGGG